MTPVLSTARGTKRHCQNASCSLPFYDLNRTAIVCPNCSSAYVPPVPEPPRVRSAGSRYSRPFARPSGPVEPTLEATPSDDPVADAVVPDADADGDVGDGQAILEVDEDEDSALTLDVPEEPQKDD